MNKTYMRTTTWMFLGILSVMASMSAICTALPVLSNVTAVQRTGTKLVDIIYDVSDADSTTVTVSVAVSTNNGVTYDLPATHFSGNGYGTGVTSGVSKQIVWDAGTDWDSQYSTQIWFQVTADDGSANSWFVLIPACNFTMGDTFGDLYADELPTHDVSVSAFYMEATEVTWAQWWSVHQWATNHGYSFADNHLANASDYPVEYVAWYDCVKWCNARSEKDGLTPCYYTSSAQSTIYRTGNTLVLSNDWVKWTANGYRLPTEAEWEKAARGGVSGHRFPWADTDTISHDRANFYNNGGESYATGTTGYHPTYYVPGEEPYTSPVGSFAANGYGLYDMAGNVAEWCWDWYSASYYSSSPASDPLGPPPVDDPLSPVSLSARVARGGCWALYADLCRVARRDGGPRIGNLYVGLRCVRGQTHIATHIAYAGPVTVDTCGTASQFLAGDFDGDRLADPVLYDENTGTWAIKCSMILYQVATISFPSGHHGHGVGFGAHFDGDDRADLAVYQASTGTWLMKLSSENYSLVTLTNFLGGSGWTAVAADFDGDAKADPAVYQTSTGNWQIKFSSANYALIPLSSFLGGSGWTALAADFDADGKDDPAVYNESTGYWGVKLSTANYMDTAVIQFGGSGYTALAGDFDGDRLADPAVVETSTGDWIVRFSSGNYAPVHITLIFE